MSPCERWCVCICMHRCSHRAGSSLIIGSTQDTWRSGSKSGSYQVGSLEQVLQERSFCGLSTSVKQEQGILFGVFLCLHSPHMQKIKIGCQLCHHYVLWCLGSVKSAWAFYLLHSALSYNSVAVWYWQIDSSFFSRQGKRHSMDMSCTFYAKVVEITANSQSLYFDTLILCISVLSLLLLDWFNNY